MRLTAIAIVILGMAVPNARAAKAPLSPDALRKAASHIVQGKVVRISSKIQNSKVERAFGTHRDRVFTIKLKVATILKGTGLNEGDEIEVLVWQPSSRIPPLPGLQGHEKIPNKGDKVTVYVKGKKGKAYEPILPNGITILARAAAQAPVKTERNKTTPAATAKDDSRKSPMPKDVPPIMGSAVFVPSKTKDDGYHKWSVKLKVPKVAWEVVGERRLKSDWPRLKVTVEEAVLTPQMGYHRAIQLADSAQNRVLDLKGRRLKRDEALKRLAAQMPVLVSVSGRMPDPFYLQCTKSDTLIVVLGYPYYPAPQLLPRPAKQDTSNKAVCTEVELELAIQNAKTKQQLVEIEKKYGLMGITVSPNRVMVASGMTGVVQRDKVNMEIKSILGADYTVIWIIK